jgi:hypothetical protein
MPKNLGLVFIKRNGASNNQLMKPPMQLAEKNAQDVKTQNTVGLRRVMDAPKTGCRSCGG